MSSVRLVLDDIIENNTQFKLPGMGRTQSYI
nr:MAG TPA: DNA-binding domain protein [Bacteriophage sp.]